MTIDEARPAIRQLGPGVVVGHANPELADWEGKITPNRNGRLWDLDRAIRVAWHAGTIDDGAPMPMLGKSGFFVATGLTVKGECPDCARPAHYIFAGNGFDRSEGWNHDSPADARTCWAGKAALEAPQSAKADQIIDEAVRASKDEGPNPARRRWRGAHKQVSEVRTVDVPAAHGVGPHRDFLVTTACGQEVPTTLVTRRDDLVRCPDCRVAQATQAVRDVISTAGAEGLLHADGLAEFQVTSRVEGNSVMVDITGPEQDYDAVMAAVGKLPGMFVSYSWREG